FGFGGLRPKQELSMTNRRQNPSQTRVNPQNRFSISEVGRKQEVMVSGYFFDQRARLRSMWITAEMRGHLEGRFG
ncbi:MAG: hypothetical protein KBH07_09465, partial [Flavobacteriales bacterium]|nr:hypothetical protein [Flavobacteriales bacterium]